MNKKMIVTPVAVLLCIVMLGSFAAPITAQSADTADTPIQPTRNYTYIDNVISSHNVISPNYIKAGDGVYAWFCGKGSSDPAMLIGQLNTVAYKGSEIMVKGYGTYGSVSVRVFIGTSSSSLTLFATRTFSGTPAATYNFGAIPKDITYVAISIDGDADIDWLFTS